VEKELFQLGYMYNNKVYIVHTIYVFYKYEKKISVVANLLFKMTKENVTFVNDVRSDFSGDWQNIKVKEDIEISDKFIMKQWTTQKDRQTKSVVCPVNVIPHKKKWNHTLFRLYLLSSCVYLTEVVC